MQLSKFRILVGLCFCTGLAQTVHASRFNVLSGRTGGPANGGATCQSCHGNTVGTGSVQILGAPDSYQANRVYDLTVRVADPTKLGAGFQISVEDAIGNHIGTLSVIDAVKTELNPDDNAYLNHTSDGVDASVAAWAGNGNSYSYPVRWTAPATDMGTITFWVAGNAINNNFSPGCSEGCAPGCCDIIYLTHKSAAFQAIPAVSTWGMVVLTLCVLAAGTMLSIRRKKFVLAPVDTR